MELNVMQEQIEPPQVVLDKEDAEALFVDCYTFVDSVLGRSGNPKWLEKEGHDLLNKLSEVLAWYKIQ